MKDIKSLKSELKVEAFKLRETKADIKTKQKAGQYAGYKQSELLTLKWNYRHRHIAYSIMRGKSYQQIERKCREDNQPNFDKIKELINEYTPQKENVCPSS